ncbi:aldehyde dehydrogenase (NAD+) [Kwoniella mangroviensis CBS 10435]|uniref:Aldehyde dehydrogenase (NAD+) n=1 Tax=Kwoniella mangroviensis CBS 10435 TaxID=1331196 RepID=A0A1B9IKR3_9TREE|nr:aldehyde dehydrogenase (NAD+) [Kwoniella mangroviensis CBS 10435]
MSDIEAVRDGSAQGQGDIPDYIPTSLEEIDKVGLRLPHLNIPYHTKPYQTNTDFVHRSPFFVYTTQIYARLNARFDSLATHSLAYRLYNLKQLGYLIKDNEKRIQAAVYTDLGKGGFDVSSGDLWPILNEIDLAVRRVKGWMKDESRIWDAMFSFKFMRPRIKKQPKGIISAWNFPWQLTLCPLIGAIAAGCPAVIKVSEHAPSSSALIAELLPRYLDPEGYAVVLGAAEESTKLLEKSWGHILYTGSGNVGKIVAAAAAKTLTPTTLELGGKSPVVVSSCANMKIAARRMFTIKQMAAGQICIAPDYVLVVKDKVNEFIDACKETVDTLFPPSPSPWSFLHTPQSSSMRNTGDFDRMISYIDRAEQQGKLVHRGEINKDNRRIGISLVKMNPNAEGESGGLVEDEVFGPVMAIIPVDDIDAAIRYINARPHPLALYVCASKRSVFKKVIDQTWSGSATWNDFAFATYARNLPFGGVGASGWGSYHGKDGFDTFTHHKSVLEIPYIFEPLMALRYPPLTNLRKILFKFLLCAGVGYSRPVSVEREESKLRRKKVVKWMTTILVGLVAVYLGGLRWRSWKG